jgi:hypothetical protein
MVISRSFLLRIGNSLEKKFVEKIKTRILYSIPFSSENRVVCGKLW